MIDFTAGPPSCSIFIRDGGPDLWFSDSPAEREQAAVICSSCPVREQCAQDWRDDLEGVWAGEDHTPPSAFKIAPEDRICPRGHVGQYRYEGRDGHLHCAECSRIRARESQRRKRRVCPRGHKGQYKAPKGKPGKAYCKECKRERTRAYRAALTTALSDVVGSRSACR